MKEHSKVFGLWVKFAEIRIAFTIAGSFAAVFPKITFLGRSALQDQC